MKKLIGTYLEDNNYYVGSIDKENKLIWISIEGSDDFTEFTLQTNAQGELYFLHENQRVDVRLAA